ncbi:mechanosensitive ion channel [Candidatus Babeliales bacterium]|nr:mechanosensitive ion channel [Candidatus Babeliales bacterium]
MRAKIIVLSLLFIFSGTPLCPMMDFFTPQKQTRLPFLTEKDAKKKQHKKVASELEEFKKSNSEKNKKIAQSIDAITKDMAELEKQKATPQSPELLSYINKKMDIFANQKQHLILIQNTLKNIEETYEKNIQVLEKTLEFLQTPRAQGLKTVYSWQELRTAQKQAADTWQEITEEEKKKEDSNKLKNKERELITSLKKQVEINIKERDKVVAEAKVGDKKDSLVIPIQDTEDLYNQENNLLEEKISLTENKIKLIEQEVRLKENEIDLLKHQHIKQKETLAIIEDLLVLTLSDVDFAKKELDEAQQKERKERDELDKKIKPKETEKGRLSIQQDTFRRKLNSFPEDKKDTVNYYLTESESHRINTQYAVLEKDIKLLEGKKLLAAQATQLKDLQYQLVDIRYKLSTQKLDLDEFLNKYLNLKNVAAQTLEEYKKEREKISIKQLDVGRKKEVLKLEKNKLLEKKDTLFKDQALALQTITKRLAVIKQLLKQQVDLSNEYLVVVSALIGRQEDINHQHALIIETIERRKNYEGLWKVSPKAISFEDFKRSLLEAENFFKEIFWDTPQYLGPSVLLAAIKTITFYDILALFFFLFFFLFIYACLKIILQFMLKRATIRLTGDRKNIGFLSLNIAISLLKFGLEHLGLIFGWIFIYVHIIFDFKFIFSTISFFAKPYYVSMFYLLTIPIFVYLSRELLVSLKELNRRLSFFFFAEKLQDRFLLLITFFCYSTATLLPLRRAFLSYYPDQPTIFPAVLIGAYSLALVIIVLLFFSKEDVLRLIPERYTFLVWIKQQIDAHYYPVFFFIMSLLILSNPYIGYSNLAWFLAFVVPSTALLISALFIAHYYIRKYSVFLFMKEEEEEIIDKFEHAKTYYGFVVIFSFLTLTIITFILVARIWGFAYAPADLWRLFSAELVIPIGPEHKLGLVQLVELILFIVGGFVASSLLHKFVLNKLFDILRTEPGAQNTYSRILHYAIILSSSVLGFMFIHLENMFWYVGTLMSVAAGFAVKDLAADYIAGFLVLIERPIEIGNFIMVDDSEKARGTVHKIDARTTTVVNIYNHSMIIPNKDLIAKKVDNWSKGRFATGFDIRIRVDYKSDPDLTKNIITEVIQSNPTILRVPRLIVRLEDFEESALYFLARAFISTRRVKEQWTIASTIREEIFKAFKEKGIHFAFPQRVLHMEEKKFHSFDQSPPSPSSPIQFKFDSQ